MLVLCIDTSGPACAAGVYDDHADRMISEISEIIGKGHAERLMEMIAAVLNEARLGFGDIDRIAVTVGPGSFTGIRVGVAAARGLALAIDRPAVGVSTLAVLAEAHERKNPEAAVLALIDAKRGEIYAEGFSPAGMSLSQASVMPYEDARHLAANLAAECCGSGAAILEGAETAAMDAIPLALVGRIGARSGLDRLPKPLYIRGADAKPQHGFAVSRA